MFGSRRNGTVIAEGLKIMGSVTADGLVEVHGHVDGELHCTSLIISRKAHVTGAITAERVVVNGRVEGPIQGGEVVLKSQAHVVGDVHHQSLCVEKGAYFEGRSVQSHGSNGQQPDRAGKKSPRELTSNSKAA
jgi:cytoskeletal protein CcmA (bactofilin family)